MKSYAMVASFVVRDKLEVYSNFRTFRGKLLQIKNIVMERMEDPLSYKIVDTNSDSFEQLGLLAIFIQNIFFSIIFMFVIVAYFVITSVTSLAIEQKN